jgi:peptidyl-prolyl cis-trans isomerase SurA
MRIFSLFSYTTFVCFFLLFSLPFTLTAQEELDGIAAVVGDEVILLSELEAYSLLRLNALDIKPDSAEFSSLQQRFLDELIDGKVLLVRAEEDTAIEVNDDEVEMALEQHVAGLLKQNRMTMEQLEEELKKQEGISLSQFKDKLRKGIREQLIKQKVQQIYATSISLNKKDVVDFFNQYKDSLPSLGPGMHLSKLTITVAASDSIRQSAFDRVSKIRQRLDEGEKFVTLARQYSEDPNAENGGDLGFIEKGTLNELTFEEKVFSLQPGEISEPFETRFGWHIVMVEARRDQRVHVRQIFFRVAPSEEKVQRVESLLDSIREHCETKEDFDDAVVRFSTDEQLKAVKGEIGWVNLYEIPDVLKENVDSLTAGDISPIERTANTFILYRVNDRVEDRTLSLEDDWNLLKEKAKDIAAQKKLVELVKKWRKDTFIDIRL